ncbi:hypothetical protein AAG906_035185 [Vitis piasezkii]
MRFLGTFGIIREAVRVGIRNPSFIPLATIVSLPLFCITLLHEWLLQHILMEPSFSPQVSELPPNSNAVTRLTHMMSGTGRVLLLALLYLIPIQFLNLLTAVTTVYSASAIHAGARPLGLQDMLRNVLLLLVSMMGVIIAFGIWLVLSAWWNMGVVISILEDKGCLQALSTSQYLSKGNRVMKWVVCMVYYHDCKRRCREKVDMEEASLASEYELNSKSILGSRTHDHVNVISNRSGGPSSPRAHSCLWSRFGIKAICVHTMSLLSYQNVLSSSQIVLYLDLHGWSTKLKLYAFGCTYPHHMVGYTALISSVMQSKGEEDCNHQEKTSSASILSIYVQEFFQVVTGALMIPYKSINFVVSSLVTSLPLFFFLIFYEMILKRTLVEASEILKPPPGYSNRWDWLDLAMRMTWDFFLKLVLLGLLYLVPLHLLEFFNMIVTVNLASKLHEGEKPMALKEEAYEIFHKARLKDPFITYVYALLLSICGLLGLLWLVINYYIISVRFWYEDLLEIEGFLYHVFFSVFFGAAFIAVLIKYLDWSVVWNTSIVFSILEESYGAEALMISSYFSRGSKECGRLLMLVFFVRGVSLRLTCLYAGCSERGSGIIAQVLLFCIGNVLKWVVCTVYFQNCKKRTLEKIDGEVGLEDENVNE